ncbi:MAG TPA: DUF4159 domain-containing protein [Tepidisphaeraceae bacterium]|nr:DUF4159 domain-containing protein [Tepidisphaeraceae bacterium]
MAANIPLKCPACGKDLIFPADAAGTISICGACGAPVIVPELPRQIYESDDPTAQSQDQPSPPAAGLLDEIAPPRSAPIIPIVPITPDNPPDAPPIVRRIGPMPQLSPQSRQALDDMQRAAAAPPPPPPPPPAPLPLEPLPVPQNLPSSVPQFLPAPESPEPELNDNKIIWITVGGAAFVMAIAILLIWFIFLRQQPWDIAHRNQIEAMIQTADTLAVNHDYSAAWQKYCDIQNMTRGQVINDPQLRADLDRVNKRCDEIYELLIQPTPQPELSAVPSPTASSPPPVIAPQPTPPSKVASQTPPQPADNQQPAPQPSPPNPVAQNLPARPAIQAIPPPPPLLGPTGAAIPDDDRVGRAIRQGVDYVISAFNADGELREDFDGGASQQGADALAVYALLQAGQAIDDDRLAVRSPFMSQALDTLKQLPMDDNYANYGRSLRSLALSLADRPEDKEMLRNELRWFLHAGETGAFRYVNREDIPGRPGFPNPDEDGMWDNSNTQYGILGVWAIADAGITVPEPFWYILQKHWLTCQLPDGEWGYAPDDTSGRPSMTMAGVASLFVTHDFLSMSQREAQPLSPQLLAGLQWLETGDHCLTTDQGLFGRYALYGLERVGLASGFKYFGSHDWYPEMASAVLQDQNPNGSWGNSTDVLETCYAILFLSRGRHPIMMSKLRYNGDWDDHPRDLANLSHYASVALETPLNWQVVPATRPSSSGDNDESADSWTDWSDSPILLISSDTAPNFDQHVLDKMRDFILNGGLIITQTEDGGEDFQDWSDALGKQLFPQYSWTQLPISSPLYNVAMPMRLRPKIMAITNGVRPLILNFPDDITGQWKTMPGAPVQSPMALGVNLFVYVSGKVEFRDRLVHTYIPAVPDTVTPAATMKMAILTTGAEADPEPAAWPRFANWFRWKTNLQLNLQPLSLAGLANVSPSDIPLAHLTGVAAWQPSQDQIDAVKKYVEAGGVLLIDPCGGPNGFDLSLREQLLPRAFPDAELDRIDTSHPLLTDSADGMVNLSVPKVRLYVESVELTNGRGPQMFQAGKGYVIVAPLDLTCGVLGLTDWGIAGYQDNYCLDFARNVVLWTWDGKPAEQGGLGQ